MSKYKNKYSDIAKEVTGKVVAYEAKMGYRLNQWVTISNLLNGKLADAQSADTPTNPRSAELFKAVEAKSGMAYRMLTSQRPFFELESTDLLGYKDPSRIVYAEHYVTSQLDASDYTTGLLQALKNLYTYGTSVVHETYEPERESFLGQPRFITTFRPVPLINCSFALDSYKLQESSWVALSDITSKTYLAQILRTPKFDEIYDESEIKAAQTEKYEPEPNIWSKMRLASTGMSLTNFEGGIETCTYYGPLDCMEDDKTYVVDVINKTHVIRCEEYIGIRPVRIATINISDVDKMGNGIGEIFAPLLAAMDHTQTQLRDTLDFMGANMFIRDKKGSEEDLNWHVQPFGILELDGGLSPLSPSASTAPLLRQELESKRQEFRQAAGAPDILQAIVNGDATATEVSLGMNEAVRTLSIEAEMAAKPLVKDHIAVILQNAFRYLSTAYTVQVMDKNTGKRVPVTISPDVIKLGIDVRLKTMTDQDFRPSKINHLINTLQLMSSIKPDTMQGYRINVQSVLLELLKTLDVPDFQNSIQAITQQDLLKARMIQEVMTMPNQQPGQTPEALGPQSTAPMQMINTKPMRNRAGETAALPGDIQDSIRTIQSESAPRNIGE